MDIESIKKLWFVGGQITGDDVELLIEQAEKLEEIRKVFYAEDTNVVDGYKKIIEVFEGKKIPTRKKRN